MLLCQVIFSISFVSDCWTEGYPASHWLQTDTLSQKLRNQCTRTFKILTYNTLIFMSCSNRDGGYSSLAGLALIMNTQFQVCSPWTRKAVTDIIHGMATVFTLSWIYNTLCIIQNKFQNFGIHEVHWFLPVSYYFFGEVENFYQNDFYFCSP